MKKYQFFIFILLLQLSPGLNAQEQAYFTIVPPVNISADSITVEHWDEIISFGNHIVSQNKRMLRVPRSRGAFSFSLPTTGTSYFRFGWKENSSAALVLPFKENVFKMCAGDSVLIKVDSAVGLSFTGRGSIKYGCWDGIRKADVQNQEIWWDNNRNHYDRKSFHSTLNLIKDKFSYIDSAKLSFLEEYRNELGKEDYERLKLEILAKDYRDLLMDVSSLILRYSWNYFPDIRTEKQYKSSLANYLQFDDFAQNFSESQKLNSLYFPKYKASESRLHWKISGEIRQESLFVNFQNRLRAKLLTVFYLNYAKALSTDQIDYAKKLSKQVIRTAPYIRELQQSILKDGNDNRYLQIDLMDQYGKYFKLADLKGKVVFIDFWFTGCAGCSGYYRTVVSQAEKRIDPDNVVFVSISSDKDREKWLKSVQSGNYCSIEQINVQSPLGLNAPIIDAFGIVAYPQPILLDREGEVFTTSAHDLRERGVEGLLETIERAKIAE